MTTPNQSDLATQLRGALRGMAQTVTVIAASDAQGQRVAMAATAVTPLSMDPPSMLVCINRSASAYPTLVAGTGFSINLLGATHLDVAHACGGGAQGEGRFATGQWALTDEGVPYLADAQTALICTLADRHGQGSHDIFIGHVRAVEGRGSIDPLLYADGGYRRLGEPL